MEQICDTPVLVIDGAHNPNAAKQLREEALRRWNAGGIVEIVGVLADKDFTEVGRLLAPLAKKIFTVTPNNPRALSAQDLAQCFRQFCDDVTPADNPAQGMGNAPSRSSCRCWRSVRSRGCVSCAMPWRNRHDTQHAAHTGDSLAPAVLREPAQSQECWNGTAFIASMACRICWMWRALRH